MRLAAICLLLAAVASVCSAQAPSDAMHKGAWDLGVWGGGGSGLGDRSDWKFVTAGVRVGKVLTAEHGSGFLRGNLEWSADVIPVYYVMQPVRNTYGASFTPVLLKWNFTGGKKVVPFVELGGGVLFTTFEVPPTTSTVNFTPQARFGVHIFTRPKSALTISGGYEHISNAGMTNPNPGVNAILMVRLGYNWFK